MKWLLTIGVVLLIIGCIFVLLPPNIFNPFMDLVNLSETTYNSTALVPSGQIYNISGLLYNLPPIYIHKGFSIIGNFSVITGSAVSVLGFNDNEFNSWSRKIKL